MPAEEWDPDGQASAGDELPSPLWLLGGIPARAVRDLNRCTNPVNPRTCFYNYELTIGKGPYKANFWVGVVGLSISAAKVPFIIKAKLDNFNPLTGNTNPFTAEILAVMPHTRVPYCTHFDAHNERF
jgi:hypothetical protein